MQNLQVAAHTLKYCLENNMNKRNLWLEINGIKLSRVRKEMHDAISLRKLEDRKEKEDRQLWTNHKTRDRKVI